MALDFHKGFYQQAQCIQKHHGLNRALDHVMVVSFIIMKQHLLSTVIYILENIIIYWKFRCAQWVIVLITNSETWIENKYHIFRW